MPRSASTPPNSPVFRVKWLILWLVGVGLIFGASGHRMAAGRNVWTTSGPESAGQIRAITVHPTDPSIVYIATEGGGLFKSTDGGSSFSYISGGISSLANATALAIDPSAPDTLLAAAVGRTYKSTNAGATWTETGRLLRLPNANASPAAVIRDPGTPSRWYAATSEGVFVSNDGGLSWVVSNTGLTNTFSIAMAVDPTGVIYLGTQVGVFKSSDQSSSWTRVGAGTIEGPVRAIVVDPGAPATIYAAADTGLLFKSVDAGTTWAPSASGLPAFLGSLIIDPATPGTLYAGVLGSSGVYKSVNGGGTWIASSGGLPTGQILSLALSLSDSARLFVGAGTRGLFRSVDGAASWVDSNSGIRNARIGDFAVSSAGTVVATELSRGGVYSSTTSGDSWIRGSGIPVGQVVNAVAADPFTNEAYLAATNFNQCYRSLDGGVTWTLLSALSSARQVVFDYATPARVYAGTAFGFMRSIDGGSTWSAANTGLTTAQTRNIVSIALDPSTPGVIYAGTVSGVFRSADGGSTWVSVNSNLINLSISRLAVTTGATPLVYAATGTGLFKSSNAGASWTFAGASGVTTMVVDPANPDVLYASLGGVGVIKTSDQGISWAALNEGLTSLTVRALAYHAPTRTLYAGTLGGGVFAYQESVNTAPVAEPQSVTTAEDTSLNITVAATDVDNTSLSYSIVTPPSHGTLSGTAPNLTFTPDANYNGPDGFVFRAHDGLASSEAAVTVDVTAVNDAPSAAPDSAATTEDVPVVIRPLDNDFDVESETLTISGVTAPSRGTLVQTGTSTLLYTPGPDANGRDDFTYTVADGSGGSSTAGVTVTIAAINDPPFAHAQSVTAVEDMSLPITLTGADKDSTALTFSIVAPPAHGTLSGTAPAIVYSPAANYSGPDRFTFRVNDGESDSNTAVVNISVGQALWTGAGPEGGHVRVFAADPSDASIVYAGVSSVGVIRTVDSGVSWSRLNTGMITGSAADGLIVDPRTSTTMHATANAGRLYRTTNGGGTWTQITSLPNAAKIVAHPLQPDLVYAAGYGEVFRSTNGGASWTSSNSGVPSVSLISIAVSSTGVVYVGSFGSGVLKSVDGGSTFSASNAGLTGLQVYALAVDPVSPQVVYAGTTSGLFKSTDAGAAWTRRTTGLTDSWVYSLAVDPTDPAILYAGTSASAGGKVFKTTDGALSWSAKTMVPPDMAVSALFIHPLAPQTVFAGTSGAGILRSTDRGSTWTPLKTGVGGTARSIAASLSAPNTVYTGTFAGVFRSVDGAATWDGSGSGLTSYAGAAVAVDPTDPSTVYATGFGLFKSTDGGATWIRRTNGITSGNVEAVAIDPVTPQTVYAGTLAGVFRSTDGGLTWAARSTGLGTSLEIRRILIDPVNPSTLFVSTRTGVYRSADAGASWTAAYSGLTDLNIQALAMDSVNPSTLYASVNALGSPIFKTTDAGASWARVNQTNFSNTVNSLVVDPSTPTTLYASALTTGIYCSLNSGVTWTALGTGVPVNVSVNALAVTKSPRILYAATENGVFRLVEAENDVPVVQGDSYSTDEDSTLTVAARGVLTNDVDPDDDVLSVELASGPSHGTLTLNTNGSFVYSPEPNYNGGDSFTYVAKDGSASSVAAVVSITVRSVNDVPVAANDSFITRGGTPLTVAAPGVLGNDTDIEATPLRAIQLSGPAHGAVTLADDGSFTYVPAAGYEGSDTFTYRVTDGTAQSKQATISIEIVANALLWGTVRDRATGLPIAGATVIAYNGPSVTVQTDANGHYSITGTQYPYTSGQLFVTAPGYFSAQGVAFSNAPTQRDISLVAGGAVLRGTVRDRATGTPVANASVSYNGTNTFQWGSSVRYTTTDAAGVYIFDSSQFVEAAATQGTQGGLSVSVQGYLAASASVTAVPPLPRVQDIELISVNQVILEGTVRDRATGLPIAGATVIAYNGPSITVQTDATGHYSITGTQYPYTSGQLFVSAPGYFSVHWMAFSNAPTQRDISLVAGGAVLRGTVRDRATGTPVANASVSYSGTNTFQWGSSVRYTTTDSAGVYVFDSSQFVEGAAAAGTQGSLSVSVQGYLAASASVTAAPPLPRVQDIELISANQVIVEGTVTDRATGQPIPGATVIAYNGPSATVQTDANGHYSITGTQYPYTSGQLFVSAPGYFSVHWAAFSNAPTVRDISLVAGGAVLRGTVRDRATGAPVANASVSYGGTNTFQWGSSVRYSTTDAAGVYVFDSSQFVEAAATAGTQGGLSASSAPGYFSASVSIVAVPPFPGTRDFNLEPTGATVNVTIRPSVDGIPFQVDDIEYTSTQTFTWVPGNPHTISTVSEQSSGTGARYVFRNWSDGGALNHTLVAPSSTATYTAQFGTQYLLTTTASPAAGGAITASGWFDAGTALQIAATPAAEFEFSGFSGDLTGTGNSQTLTMSAPRTVTASFVPSNRPPVAGAQASPQPARVGEALSLDASASADADGVIVSYHWDFGDGQTVTSASATVLHTYAAAGTYTAVLTVTDDDGAVDSDSVQVVVDRGLQAALTVNPPVTLTYGTTATLSSSGGTGTGAVAFSAGTSTGCNVSGAVLSVTNASGTCVVTASKEGDSNYQATTSAPATVALNKASQSVLTLNAPQTLVYGTNAALSANGGSGTGALSFSVGASTGCSVSGVLLSGTNAAGNCVVKASKQGDANYVGPITSAAVTVVLAKATSSAVLTSSPNPSSLTQPVTLTVTVAAVAPSTGTPTGTVQFFDGTTLIGSGTVAANGVATLVTSGLLTGSHTLTAAYGGDANFSTSTSGAATHTVQSTAASTQTTLTSNPNPSAVNEAVLLEAVVSPLSGTAKPGGVVEFFDGASSLGVGTLVQSQGKMRAQLTRSFAVTGSHTLTARYGGSASFSGSTSPVVAHSVYQGARPTATTTTVSGSPNPSAPGQAVTFTAVVTVRRAQPTGTVQFYVDGVAVGAPVALNASGQASLQISSLSLGFHTVTAQYLGNATFAGSTGSTNQFVQ